MYCVGLCSGIVSKKEKRPSLRGGMALDLTDTCFKAAYEVVLVFSGFLFPCSVLPALPAGIAWSREIGSTTSMAVYFVNMIDPQLSSMAI